MTAATPGQAAHQAETVAIAFHQAYEELAPQYGYRTREASAKPWDEVPAKNAALMVATAARLLETGVISVAAQEPHAADGVWTVAECLERIGDLAGALHEIKTAYTPGTYAHDLAHATLDQSGPKPQPAPELAEPVTVAGVPYSDYPSLVAAMQAEIDRERTTRLHLAGGRDEARSDYSRLRAVILEGGQSDAAVRKRCLGIIQTAGTPPLDAPLDAQRKHRPGACQCTPCRAAAPELGTAWRLLDEAREQVRLARQDRDQLRKAVLDLAATWGDLAVRCDEAAALDGLPKASVLEQATFAHQLRECAAALRKTAEPPA